MQKISKQEAVEKYGVSYITQLSLGSIELGGRNRNHDGLLRRLTTLSKMTISNEVEIVEILGNKGESDIQDLLLKATIDNLNRCHEALETLAAMQKDDNVLRELQKARAGTRENSEALLNAYEAAQARIPELQAALEKRVSAKSVEYLPDELTLPSHILEVGDDVYIADIYPVNAHQSSVRAAKITNREFDDAHSFLDRGLSASLRYQFEPIVNGGSSVGISAKQSDAEGFVGTVYGEDIYDRSEGKAAAVISLAFNSRAAAEAQVIDAVQKKAEETRGKLDKLEGFLAKRLG